MANIAKWSIGGATFAAPTNLFTTELNSLANNTSVVSSVTTSGIYDNTTNLDLYCDLFLHLASLSPTAGAYVTVYILVSTDGGTTFPSSTGSVLRNQPSQIWTTIPIDTTASTAQDIIIRDLLVPPAKFKMVFDNQAGVALNASGNTLKIATYNFNLNG